jgi:hypothetical protein
MFLRLRQLVLLVKVGWMQGKSLETEEDKAMESGLFEHVTEEIS